MQRNIDVGKPVHTDEQPISTPQRCPSRDLRARALQPLNIKSRSSSKTHLCANGSPCSPLLNGCEENRTIEKARGRSDQSEAYASALSPSVTTDCSESPRGIKMLSDTNLPKTMPSIRYEDWKKFGISLFTPHITSQTPDLYYEYRRRERGRSKQTTSSHSCNSSKRTRFAGLQDY